MCPVKMLATLFLLSFSVSLALAQADLCDNCYVWEFTTEKGERDQTTRLLSNDIEDILSSYAACKVLQRSKFAKLLEQINNEKAIESLSEVKPELKTQLKAIQAKRVIFGEVNRDFTGNVSLRLSFDNLISTQTRTNTVFLIGDDYYNFEKRKQKLTAFINSFVNPDGKLPTPAGDPKPQSGECSRDNMPYQKEINPSTSVELCQCYFYNKKITCPFIIKNLTPQIQGASLGVSYGTPSRLIIDYGKDYIASNGKVMSNSSPDYINASIPVTKYGVPAQIIFDVIDTKTKLIESLEIRFNYNDMVVFSDVPLVHGPPPTK